MKIPDEFKKEWEKTKKKLIEIGKEATEIAKKGEKELVRFSHQGKIHIDATTASLKKERLYYLIGKEYVRARTPSAPTASLKKFIDELKKLDRQQKALQRKLSSAKKKNSPKTTRRSKTTDNNSA